MTSWAIAPMIESFSAACAASGAGITFGEGFLIGGMEIGIPTFTGSLGGNLASGMEFSEALQGAAVAGGMAFVGAGLIEGSYAAGWQKKWHFHDTRIDEINQIKANYALGTKESLARAHYLEQVVARKGISVSTAAKLGWPVPKRNLWHKLWWNLTDEPTTTGWSWGPKGGIFGNVPTNDMLKLGVFPATKITWQNKITYKAFGENFLTETCWQTWTYGGTQTTETWVSAAGYSYNPYENYPWNKSPWE